MKKNILIIIVIMISLTLPLFAEEANWWEGQIMQQLQATGLKNISQTKVDDILYPYRGKQFTDATFTELQNKLYALDGVSYIVIDVKKFSENSNNSSITFDFTETPMVNKIEFKGNERINSSDLLAGVTSVSSGQFFDVDLKMATNLLVNQVKQVYIQKGFDDAKIEFDSELDILTNKVNLIFNVNEGVQKRVVDIQFEGNEIFESSLLSSKLVSKKKSLFHSGYLNSANIEKDKVAIISYYQTQGYVDAVITETKVENIESSEKNLKYQEVKIVYVINEGLQWTYAGMSVTGNSVFSDDEINNLITLKTGEKVNLESVSQQFSKITDLYYNNGYINHVAKVNENRDDVKMTISYVLNITENEQAIVDEITISGITQTKSKVFEREITLEKGKVFSKEDLITSYQNLYNTGLLTNLNYNIKNLPDNKISIEFLLEEGKQTDINFGATFGGTVDGFPISGFLQWSDKNFRGLGQDLSVNTTLSPDTQEVSLSFSDDWFKNTRWSNKFSLNFSRTQVDDVLQRGISSNYYTGEDDDSSFPLGYLSYSAYENSEYSDPADQYLMDYDLYRISFGYSTGYTFIYNVGRLSFGTGLSIGLNRAIFDSSYDPYENLIKLYGEDWQFSNKLTFAFQWEASDLVDKTKKGYVLSQSYTYAGGLLGGLSNYIKSTTSAAGYIKLFGIEGEKTTKNAVLGVSSSLNFMLPQFYDNSTDTSNPGLNWHSASLGATTYELLYIDGMTIGRGFDTMTGFSFLMDNMIEVGYPLVEDVVQAEAFTSFTGVQKSLSELNDISWYMAAGVGLKIKIPGFPLGLYLVKNATYNTSSNNSFEWVGGELFSNDANTNSGLSLVLAISTSLI